MAVIRGLAVLSGLLLADSHPVTTNNPTVTLCVTCRHEKITVCNARCSKGIFIVYGSLTPIYSNYSVRIFNRKCLCRFGIAISPLWLCQTNYYNRISEVSVRPNTYKWIAPLLNTSWFPIVIRRNLLSMFCKADGTYLWCIYWEIPIKYTCITWPRISPLFNTQWLSIGHPLMNHYYF